ncbi:hypothetical protein BC832DRAFT_428327 [Gaertneriomyces semiglobifer]|nr:hypothetical protein BC832DRAFT_428327 [Gaertneriomyces semiglobifer]
MAANRYIVPKVLMFVLYLMQCSATNYLSLVYQERAGLNTSAVGLVASIPPLLCIFAGPGLAMLADITGKPRWVLAIACLSTTGVLWLYVTMPLSMGTVCGIAVAYAITSAPIGSMTDVIVLTILGENSALYGQQRFWGALSCGIASFVVGYLVGKTGTYDTAFMWHSTIAGIFVTLLVITAQPWKKAKEFSLDDPVKPNIKQTSYLDDPDLTAEELRQNPFVPDPRMESAIDFPGRRRFSRALSRATSMMPPTVLESARRVSRRASTAASLGLAAVTPDTVEIGRGGPTFGWLFAPDVLAFFFANIVMGAVLTVVGSFLWLYLTNELKADSTVRGLTGTAQVVLQLPFFFFAKPVMGKLGVRWSITIAHIVTIVRFCCYPLLKPGPSVYGDLGIEALHGLAFSMNWVASVAYAAEIAPKGMEFLAQVLTHHCLSSVVPGNLNKINRLSFTTGYSRSSIQRSRCWSWLHHWWCCLHTFWIHGSLAWMCRLHRRCRSCLLCSSASPKSIA